MTLRDILHTFTVDDLKKLCAQLAVKPRGQRKESLVETIHASYDGEGLRRIWDSLSELEKKAVAEACYSWNGELDRQRFRARYGEVPLRLADLSRLPWKRRDEVETLRKTIRIDLLILGPRYGSGRIPSDLADRLREFVPEPEAPKLATRETPDEKAEDLGTYETEASTLAELPALLRLAEEGRLVVSDKTGMPSAKSAVAILECLGAVGNWDFYHEPEHIDAAPVASRLRVSECIKPVGWAMLLSNARLVATAGTKSKLTPTGLKSLRNAPHETIRLLWQKWLANKTHDEFRRIDVIKGQSSGRHMTASPPRREMIVSALRDCPVGSWIDIDAFSRYMQATNRRFEVTHDEWKLYIEHREYGSLGYDGHNDWEILQLRYVLVFLFEYAATLGIVDVAYTDPAGARDDFREIWGTDFMDHLSRYDGLKAFRLTPLGAYCLGLAESFQPSRPPSSLRLSVLPSLSIRVVGGEIAPSERLLLDTWAEPIEPGSWRLDPERALAAVERGQSVDDFRDFLQGAEVQPLPESVEGFLKRCDSNARALRKHGEAVWFDCRDPETADTVSRAKGTAKLCHRAGKAGLVVLAEHETKFRNEVRKLGLGIL